MERGDDDRRAQATCASPPPGAVDGHAIERLRRDYAFVCDLDGRIVDGDERARRRHPTSIGASFASVVAGAASAHVDALLARARAFERVDGSIVGDVAVSAIRIGDRLHLLCVPLPATDHRRDAHVASLTREIAEADAGVIALVEADRRKDEFLAMLAHELRNPLAAISTALSLIALHHDDPVRLQSIQAVALRQTRHLARLVDDLLELSRVTSGKIVLQRSVVDLVAVVHEAVAVTAHNRELRSQALEVELPLERPVSVEGDAHRLQQIVSNLLDNASKYSDEGAKIRFSLHTEGEGDGRVVVARVSDDGVGIAPELLPFVFDLFVQADGSLARSSGGLGIGLTLVRALTHLHGGTVAARSDGLGRGASFEVRLPLHAGRPDRPAERAPSAAKSARRILLVEDNADIRELVTLLLRVEGHEVDSVGDGDAAIERACRGDFDLALVDIGLPGRDGYEVARTIRAKLGDRIRLFALSGYGSREDRERSMAAGFEGHLVKPVDSEELFELLARPSRNDTNRKGAA